MIFFSEIRKMFNPSSFPQVAAVTECWAEKCDSKTPLITEDGTMGLQWVRMKDDLTKCQLIPLCAKHTNALTV